MQFWTDTLLHRVSSVVRPPSVIHTAVPEPGNLVTLVAGERHCLLFAGTVDEVFMTRRLNIIPKTTEQHLIVRSGKSGHSDAAVTNNKRLCSICCTVDAN